MVVRLVAGRHFDHDQPERHVHLRGRESHTVGLTHGRDHCLEQFGFSRAEAFDPRGASPELGVADAKDAQWQSNVRMRKRRRTLCIDTCKSAFVRFVR